MLIVLLNVLFFRLTAPEELQAAKVEQARLQEEVERKAHIVSETVSHSLGRWFDPSWQQVLPVCLLPFLCVVLFCKPGSLRNKEVTSGNLPTDEQHKG